MDPDRALPEPQDEGTGASPVRRGVAVSAVLVTVLVGVSQLLGFVRDAVNAWVFGASPAYDAFLVAQGLMNLVLGLIAGAMAKATVPTVSRAAERGLPGRGLHSAQVGLTVSLVVLAAGSAFMWWAAPGVVTVLAPGFHGATATLAVELTRIVTVASLFIAATNILAAVAQARGRFFVAGLEGVPFNVVMIAAALIFGHVVGVRAIAVGFVVGSFTRLLMQVPVVHRLGMSLRPSLDVRDAGFREMARLVPLLLLGSALSNVNTLVDRSVGSLVGPGVISALNYGYRLVQLPYALLVVTLATVLYPAFGAASLPGRRKELRRLIHRAISMLLVLLAPFVALLIVGGDLLAVIVFGRGNFDEAAVTATAIAVSGFAVGLFGLGVREVLARASYALGDARGPVGSAVVGMLVNVAGDVLLGPRFGVIGLAVSTSVSLCLAAGLLLWRLRRHDAVRPRALVAVLGVSVGGAILAGLAAAGVLAATRHLFAGSSGRPGTFGAVALAALTAVVLFAVYLLMLRLARRPELAEIRQLAHGIRRRLRWPPRRKKAG